MHPDAINSSTNTKMAQLTLSIIESRAFLVWVALNWQLEEKIVKRFVLSVVLLVLLIPAVSQVRGESASGPTMPPPIEDNIR